MKRREATVVEITLLVGALVFMAALLIPTTLDLCETTVHPRAVSHRPQEQSATAPQYVAIPSNPLTGPVAYLNWNDSKALQ